MVVLHSISALCAMLIGQVPEEAFFDSFRTALSSGNSTRIQSHFAVANFSDYLLKMGGRRGMRNLSAHMVPAPPGRTKEGAYWLVVSARQDIEADHDCVFPVVRTGDGLKLGREIAEWEPDPFGIRNLKIWATLEPQRSNLRVRTLIEWSRVSAEVAPVLRLGSIYSLGAAKISGIEARVVNADPENVCRPRDGDVVKVGGIVVVWSKVAMGELELQYEGRVSSESEDRISEKSAYVTSGWTPTIGRLPYTTETTVTGPSDWVIVSEGEPLPLENPPAGATRAVRFRCDVPISYPKIVGGKYKLAAEIQDGKRIWRSYQFEPIEQARANADVRRIQSSVRWYEENLGAFPFSSYACFDADSYYGIESYSYTLLRRDITSGFISHEIGHTYFGGLVPCAYTKDSWNEGMTQYVDSVLISGNSDRTLEAGLASIRYPTPLSDMPNPQEHGSATYYRGAYVMKMLEHEIGRDSILKALRELVATRRGAETTWSNIRPVFEKAGGKDLRAFWDDWIQNSEFPTVSITDVNPVLVEGKTRSWVTIRQAGRKFLRLRFKVVLRRFNQTFEKVVEMGGNQVTIPIDAGFEPKEASIDVFGFSLANVGAPWRSK